MTLFKYIWLFCSKIKMSNMFDNLVKYIWSKVKLVWLLKLRFLKSNILDQVKYIWLIFGLRNFGFWEVKNIWLNQQRSNIFDFLVKYIQLVLGLRKFWFLSLKSQIFLTLLYGVKYIWLWAKVKHKIENFAKFWHLTKFRNRF